MQITYTILVFVLTILVGYLLGSIPTAKIIGRLHGVDITKEGSKNAGGTNVGRVIGKKAGFLTMFLDGAKCFIPCLIVALILTFAPIDLVSFPYRNEIVIACCSLSVALGHSYPLYSHFKGGKCVACFAGYVLFVSPILFALGASTFTLVFFWKKRVSLASLLGAPTVLLLSLVPAILDLTVLKDPTSYNGGMFFASNFMLHLSFVTTITLFLLAAFIAIRHRSNIKRLAEKTEPETHFKKD